MRFAPRSMFDEALSRDPERCRRWIVLVDGEPKQLAAVKAEARRAGVKVTILLDVVHVIEYVWKAARALFGESNPESIVDALAVLEDERASRAAAAKALTRDLGPLGSVPVLRLPHIEQSAPEAIVMSLRESLTPHLHVLLPHLSGTGSKPR